MKKIIIGFIVILIINSCNKIDITWELSRKNKLDTLCNENPLNPNLPVAIINASSRVVKMGSVVTFTSNSINNPSIFNWSFPGGNSVSFSRISENVQYISIGRYDVKLKVGNPYGSDSVIKKNYVEANYTKSFSEKTWDGWINNGWSFSNSGNILAWQNNSNTPLSFVIKKTFSNVATNPKLNFFYNIYSPAGSLVVKVNNIEVWNQSGYGSNTASVQLPVTSDFVLEFEATVGYTQSIYLNNITITP
jgi:PKD repeat protein